MTQINRLRGLALAAFAFVSLGAAGVRAADLPAIRQVASAAPLPALEPDLTVTTTAYVWATGLDGRLRTLPPLPAVNVSIGFDQVLKNLDGGLMAGAEVKYGRFLLFFDLLASRISPNKTVYPAGYPAGVKLDSGSFMGLAAAGYRLIEDPLFSFDAMVGIRGIAMKNTLRVDVAPVMLKLSESEQWVDGVVGARLKVNLTPSLYLTTMGFVGKGGSRYEWDAFGGLGYAFDERWSVFAGYRALKVDYRNGPFVFNALQQGPLMGLSARF